MKWYGRRGRSIGQPSEAVNLCPDTRSSILEIRRHWLIGPEGTHRRPEEATSALAAEYAACGEAIPRVGSHWIACDGAGMLEGHPAQRRAAIGRLRQCGRGIGLGRRRGRQVPGELAHRTLLVLAARSRGTCASWQESDGIVFERFGSLSAGARRRLAEAARCVRPSRIPCRERSSTSRPGASCAGSGRRRQRRSTRDRNRSPRPVRAVARGSAPVPRCA